MSHVGQLPSDAQKLELGRMDPVARLAKLELLLVQVLQSPGLPHPGPKELSHATQWVHCTRAHIIISAVGSEV